MGLPGVDDNTTGLRLGLGSNEYGVLAAGKNTRGLQFFTSNTLRMSIDNAGGIGIGTSSVVTLTATLQVSGTFTVSTTGQTTTPSLYVISSGTVGIGTINPNAKLDVVGTISASDAIQMGASTLACSTGISAACAGTTHPILSKCVTASAG